LKHFEGANLEEANLVAAYQDPTEGIETFNLYAASYAPSAVAAYQDPTEGIET